MVAVIDEVFADINAQIEADFGPIELEANSKRDVLDWLHFRARMIPQRFRQVILSKEVRAAMPRYPAIAQIKYHLSNAGDVRPWLSDRIRKRKSDPRADMLFNDWKISHFHLKPINKEGKVVRSKELLFAYINSEIAVLIKICSHADRHLWTDQSLLETLLETHPPAMEAYEVKGIIPPQSQWSNEELGEIRRGHLTSFVQFDGRVFAPGLGISTSGHAVRLVFVLNRFYRTYSRIKSDLINNQFSIAALQPFLFSIGLPVRLGCRLNFDGRLELLDKSGNRTLWTSPPLE